MEILALATIITFSSCILLLIGSRLVKKSKIFYRSVRAILEDVKNANIWLMNPYYWKYQDSTAYFSVDVICKKMDEDKFDYISTDKLTEQEKIEYYKYLSLKIMKPMGEENLYKMDKNYKKMIDKFINMGIFQIKDVSTN